MRSSVLNCRAFPGADVGSDHQLVIANYRLKLKIHRSWNLTRKFDIKKLQDPGVTEEYSAELEQIIGVITKANDQDKLEIDQVWEKVKVGFHETSRKILGYRKREREKEWISDDTYKLVDERKVLKASKSGNPTAAKHYNFLCREIRRRCKQDKDLYINGICKEVEEAQMQKKSRKVYEAIRKIQGKHNPQPNVIKDKKGVILTDPVEVKARWVEHFNELYNQVNNTDNSVLMEIPDDYGKRQEQDCPQLTKDEVRYAIKHLKTGKAPGVDMVTAEEIAAAGEYGVDVMYQLCSRIWEEERFPEEWKQSVIIPIYKKKDKLVCDNYRGISLLCHAEKLMASIILRRIKPRTEEILTEAQAGFRANRSTIDQLLSLRLLAEKYMEHGKDLYICYVDFQKAFDSVWRQGLWQVMRHLGYDCKIVKLLEGLYKATKSSVRVGSSGEVSNWFETLVGVLQGCVLSPLLFNIMLEVVMAMGDQSESLGVKIAGARCSNLRFADDISLLADNQADLQTQVNLLHGSSSRFGLKISAAKTETQRISRNPVKDNINIDIAGIKLNQVEDFTYLGGVISSDGRCGHDIRKRIGLATGASSSLNIIWASKDINKDTKVRVYKSLVLSILLYNSETWTLKEADKSRLRVFEMTVLRRICGVTLRDRWRNEDIRSSLGMEMDIVKQVQRRRLTYFGHVIRMDKERWPNVILHGNIHGSRPKGRPRKRWMDCINADCEEMDITLIGATRLAEDRTAWRNMVFKLSTRS